MKFFTAILCLFVFVADATTYYVSPSGNDSNDGLTPGAAKTIALFYSIAASNMVIALDGDYNTNIIIRTSGIQFIASNRWTARIVGKSTQASAGIAIWVSGGNVSNCVVDGFCITNSGTSGINIQGPNNTIRNCWIQNSGSSHGVNSGSGIETVFGASSAPQNGTVIEYNLLENNGYSTGFDHGMYVSGTNCIIRNNVCRGNLGGGISLYGNSAGSGIDNAHVYGNLIYNNHGFNVVGGAYQVLGVNCLNNPGGINYIYGNTILQPTNVDAILVEDTTIMCSNNIIVASGDGFTVFSTGPTTAAFGDYNLAAHTLYTAGAHDVITNYYGFVNTNSGLYWLAADSPARGAALSSVYGAVDFFGNAQSSVADIGAFQYSVQRTLDHRTLDPSPPSGADYWATIRPSTATTAHITTARTTQ